MQRGVCCTWQSAMGCSCGWGWNESLQSPAGCSGQADIVFKGDKMWSLLAGATWSAGAAIFGHLQHMLRL